MASDSPQVVESLERLLADSYALYLKTQSYHWNVTGPMFTTLHTLFESQYTELATAIDEVAERIRALGSPAPGSFTQFSALSTVVEDTSVPKADDMVRLLEADQEKVVVSAKSVVRAAEDANDDASVDLGVRRIDVHEKNAWMLRSHRD